MTKTSNTYSKANFAEQLAMYELLQKVLFKPEGSEYYTYAQGWDDERVAHTVSKRLSRSHAAFVRTTKFGQLKGWSKREASTPEVIEQRVQRLERIVERLCAELGYKDAAE